MGYFNNLDLEEKDTEDYSEEETLSQEPQEEVYYGP